MFYTQLTKCNRHSEDEDWSSEWMAIVCCKLIVYKTENWEDFELMIDDRYEFKSLSVFNMFLKVDTTLSMVIEG